VWAGVDSAWEQEKLKATLREMFAVDAVFSTNLLPNPWRCDLSVGGFYGLKVTLKNAQTAPPLFLRLSKTTT
jgi:hypothetical protein